MKSIILASQQFFVLIISLLIIQNTKAQSIGMGTVTPHTSAALDITSSNKGILIPRVTFSSRPSNPATGLLIYQTDGASGFYYWSGSIWRYITPDAISFSGNAGQIPFYGPSNNLTVNNGFVWDNNTQRLGIGTSSPSAALEVNSNGYIVTTLKSNHAAGSGINLNSVGNRSYTILSTGTGAGSGAGKLGFYDETAGVYRMVLDESGNLGVGNNTPTSKLDVNGLGGLKVSTTNNASGSYDWIAGNFGGSSGNRVVMGLNDGNATIGAHNNTLTSWSNLLINPGGGNVGIGTNSATTSLHVKSANSGSVLSLEGATGTTESYIQFYPNTYASGRKAWLGFGTGGTDFRITNENNGHVLLMPGTGGNVGIGNTNPQQMLDVAGTIRSSALSGTGSRMVVAHANGDLSTQELITNINDVLGSHTATQNINLSTHKLVGNNGTNGIAIANDGTVTVNTLTGTDLRMVVADANGDLATQPIATNVDGMGNHTASQNLALSNRWMGNSGHPTGLVINNSGHVGINFSIDIMATPFTTPQGVLDVPKYYVSDTYANYHGPNLSGLSTNTYWPPANNVLYTVGGDPQNPFKNINTNIGWSPYMSNSWLTSTTGWTTPILVVDFGAGNAKVIRRYVLNCRFNLNDDSFARYHYVLEGSNDGVNYSYVHDLGRYTTKSTGFNIPPIGFDNTIAYRYYRFRFGEVKIGSLFYAKFGEFTVTGIELNEQSYITSNISGGLLATTTGNIGIGTTTPSSNLDVTGSLRLRNGAANNRVLKGDADGNATWSTMYRLFSLDISVPSAIYPYVVLDMFNPIASSTTPSYGTAVVDWNHNLGYQPNIMFSLDQSDVGSSLLEHVNVNFQHITNNTIRFSFTNMAAGVAIGKLRIAIVN